MSKRGENIYKRKDGRWEGRFPKGRKGNGSIQYGYVYGKSYQEVREKVYVSRVKYQSIFQLQGQSAIPYDEWVEA